MIGIHESGSDAFDVDVVIVGAGPRPVVRRSVRLPGTSDLMTDTSRSPAGVAGHRATSFEDTFVSKRPDRAYHLRRACEERESAARSGSEAARAVHVELAALHAKKADASSA